MYLGSSSSQHDRDLYTWWSSDAAAVIGDSRLCVICLNPHEGVALQVAPHMPEWLLYFRPGCSSSHLMISASTACSASLICIYQLDVVSPSLYVGGHLDIFVSHVIKSSCISPDGYSRHRMYVGFISLFIWLMFRPAYASSLRYVVFPAPYSLYYCIGGHRYAYPAAFHTGTTSSPRHLLHL